jgi:excisionase family DNA binding protein
MNRPVSYGLLSSCCGASPSPELGPVAHGLRMRVADVVWEPPGADVARSHDLSPPASSSNQAQGPLAGRNHHREEDDDHARLTVMSEVVPLLYRVDEAAAALRLSRSSVYELIRSGQLRTVKQGRRRLVPVTALAEYIASLGGAA